MPAQVETTHTILPRELIIYQRERSDIWQCRYKVESTWVRCSTKESNLKKAKEAARVLLYEAKARASNGLPIASRKFKVIAEQAIKRLENDATNDRGLRKYNDYVRVLKKYHIPFFGKYQITSIDYPMLDRFDEWRIKEMEKEPSKSTIQTHNAAFNRVFDEAITQGYLTELTRPKLTKISSKKQPDNRRPAFAEEDLPKLLSGFEDWVEVKKHKKSRELGLLLKDYICVLLDTGARPGTELMDLKWNQVKYEREPISNEEIMLDDEGNEVLDDDGNPILVATIEQDLWLKVSGKTGTRDVLGSLMSRTALQRIAKRNFDLTELQTLSPFWIEDFLHSQNHGKAKFVFRLKDGSKPTSFEALFDSYLDHIGIPKELSTGKKYTFYSLRHTYATLKLQYEGVAISTLAKHMGTSVSMIEKHYSHLDVRKVKGDLRGRLLQDIPAAFSK